MVEIIKSNELEGVYYILDPDTLPVYKGFIELDRRRVFFTGDCELKEETLNEIMKIFSDNKR